MPKRKNIIEVPTPDVQGEGSWVKVRRPTVNEVMASRKSKPEPEVPLTKGEGYEANILEIMPHIVDWNWVDSDGLPLPNPVDQPDIWMTLTDLEIECLLDALHGSGRDIKN